MNINADFDVPAFVHAADQEWINSPMPGVLRKPLDRVGDEVARATSIVKYAPNSTFSAHTHHGGEEFLVLDGVFQDEHANYPAGYYVRNPPQTRHTPRSEAGCTILVKLWQFDPQDTQVVQIDTAMQEPVLDPNNTAIQTIALTDNQFESVSMQFWAAGATIKRHCAGGVELFLMSGEARINGEFLKAESWMRLPCNALLEVRVGKVGAKVWLKEGHLSHVPEQLARLQKAG